MNLSIQKVIEKLGYKRREAQLYIAALVLGEAKVSDLAEKLKIPRTSAIMIAEKLHKEGLLNYYIKSFNKYWVAENPDKLLLKLKDEQATLQAVLPKLKALQPNVASGKPTARTYVGSKELKFIFEDIILAKRNFRAIIAWNDLSMLFGQGYLSDFIERHGSHFLKFQLLTPESEATRALKERDVHESRETRLLPKHTISLNTATFMYGNKIALVSLNETLPTGFLIEDPDLAHTMGLFFDELWSHNP